MEALERGQIGLETYHYPLPAVWPWVKHLIPLIISSLVLQ